MADTLAHSLAYPFVPTDEQHALRDAIDDYTARRWSEERLREVLDVGPDPRDLRILGSELGVLGLTVPEALGGAGAGVSEAAVVAERLGRRLAAVPFTSSVLAAEVLGGSPALDALLAGERSVVVVATDARGAWLPATPSLTAAETAGSWTVSGTAAHVVDAPGADVFAVLAGDRLLLVEADAAGVTRTPITSLDLTRPQATVAFDAAPATLLDGGADVVRAASDRVAVLLAAEALGAAERLLEISVEHAATRMQFGRAIGSYQGVKHQLADLFVAVEQTRSVVEHAAFTADHPDDPGADSVELTASAARVLAAQTLVDAAATAVQVHGGIGFTWEHVAHLYFKRAHSDAVLWGGLAPHRERIAALALDTLTDTLTDTGSTP